MRPGPLEIILIIIVVIAVAVIARIIRAGRSNAGTSGAETKGITVKSPGKNRLWKLLNRTGIVLVIAGIAGLAAAAGLFRWVLQSYLWALVIIAAGFIMVLFARRKR